MDKVHKDNTNIFRQFSKRDFRIPFPLLGYDKRSRIIIHCTFSFRVRLLNILYFPFIVSIYISLGAGPLDLLSQNVCTCIPCHYVRGNLINFSFISVFAVLILITVIFCLLGRSIFLMNGNHGYGLYSITLGLNLTSSKFSKTLFQFNRENEVLCLIFCTDTVSYL